MKESQWFIAVLALAAMIFVVVFATQYLGSAPEQTKPTSDIIAHELNIPFPVGPVVEAEEKTPGYQDFVFHNLNKETVKVGLHRTSCRCSSVEILVLPNDVQTRLPATVVGAIGAVCDLRPTTAITLAQFMGVLQQKAQVTELLTGPASVDVPPGATGWVRLKWKGDKAAHMQLMAKLWFSHPMGKEANLETRLILHEPIKMRPTLEIATQSLASLSKGKSTYPIYVWSSTRASFGLKAQVAALRADPSQDPFVVGEPEPLSPAECMERQLELHSDKALPNDLRGSVLSGWRIPVRLLPLAPDGKTPFDIGPIRRRVLITSPDLPGAESKSVLVTGRVRGPVEIGNENGSDLAFGAFRRTAGSRREQVALTADSSEVEEMRIDRKRTAAFLAGDAVKLAGPDDLFGGRRVWTLAAQVPANKVVGDFPRKGDPAYEDTAVYLEAIAKGKPTRSIRVAVNGTATE